MNKGNTPAERFLLFAAKDALRWLDLHLSGKGYLVGQAEEIFAARHLREAISAFEAERAEVSHDDAA